MCHTSPPTYLAWAALSTLLGAFLLFHIWKFDHFKCLRWNNGPYSGAFKRIMTYTYLTSVPLIMAYSIGFCIIKYQEGYTYTPEEGIIPMPYEYWSAAHRQAILPLYMLFSIAWGLEMVTHLEELCFWLFLINAGAVQQDWFRSLYFKVWAVGSVAAIAYMPAVTAATHSNPLTAEAYTFLAGSIGSLILTIFFMPVLFMFPRFLNSLKSQGVDMSTIVRLTTFHELNCIRVVFRFLFCAPFFVLGLDGVIGTHVVNDSEWWTEFLTFIAGIGCMVSSGITLVIFFPRSIHTEVQARHASRDKSQQMHTFRTTQHSEHDSLSLPQKSYVSPYTPQSQNKFGEQMIVIESQHLSGKPGILDAEFGDGYGATPTFKVFAPNRRLDSGATVEGGVTDTGLTEGNLARHNYATSQVHPFVHTFTSPIDLMQGDSYQGITRYGRRYA